MDYIIYHYYFSLLLFFYIALAFPGFYSGTDFFDGGTIPLLLDLFKDPLLRPSKTITYGDRAFCFFYANPDFHVFFMQIGLLLIIEVNNPAGGCFTIIKSSQALDSFKLWFFDKTFYCYFPGGFPLAIAFFADSVSSLTLISQQECRDAPLSISQQQLFISLCSQFQNCWICRQDRLCFFQVL